MSKEVRSGSNSDLTIKFTQLFFHAIRRRANQCETFDTYPMVLNRFYDNARFALGARCQLFVEGYKGIAMV